MLILNYLIWPSKSDSAPVRGDGYEPSLRSSDPEPTQRRRTACGQDLVVVVGVEGGGEKFSDGEISKTTTVGPLQFSYTVLLFQPVLPTVNGFDWKFNQSKRQSNQSNTRSDIS